jgi:hypothetical protein
LGSCALCRVANPFDMLEQFLTFVLPQHAPEQFSEHAHVVAKGPMRIVFHRAILQFSVFSFQFSARSNRQLSTENENSRAVD